MISGEAFTAVTVILVTRDRCDWLKRCIQSLLSDYRKISTSFDLDFRIGVQGEDPATESLLAGFRSDFDGVCFRNFDNSQTPASIRNALVKEALREKGTSGWFYFIDDDAYVPKGFFQLFARALSTEQGNSAVLGGPNLTPQDSGKFQRATGLALSSRLGSYLSHSRYRKTGNARTTEENELILCNLFVRKELFSQLSFPEAFYCGEENLFLFEAHTSGRELRYLPELFVWHERRGSPGHLFRQVFNYGKSRSRNFLLRPGMLYPAHLVPSLVVLMNAAAFLYFAMTGRLPALWLFLAFCYLALAMGAALRRGVDDQEDPRILPLVILSFVIIHLAYGLGFLAGFLNRQSSALSPEIAE